MTFEQMKRRDFIALVGRTASWPLVAHAQRPAMPVVGYLYTGSPEPTVHLLASFRKGLNDTGYVEGQNVAIEFRWARNDLGRLPELASDLVRRRVAVIVTPGSFQAALAAKAATTTIPIVFSTGVDPVQAGLVASLNRPGGNVTGVNYMQAELTAKQLGVLHELLPAAKRFAVLVNPNNPLVTDSAIAELKAAATVIGAQIEAMPAASNGEIDAVFAELAQMRIDAALVSPGPLFGNRRVQIVTLAARHAVPTMYYDREFAEVGGLISYGTSLVDQSRQTGIYTGRVLKGERPVDMPVMRASKFDLVINLATAKTLGLTVPPMLLAQADDVIE